jgi:GNAT superfamily N-acetyltransferase
MTDALQIKLLTPDNREAIDQIGRIHMSELSESPVCALGMRFMTEFYYKTLTDDGLIRTLYAVHQGRIVGFVAFTTESAGFMAKGLKRHFWGLGSVMLRSVIENPGIIAPIVRTIAIMKNASEMLGRSINAELLSIAVVPEYRRKDVLQALGISVGTALYRRFIEDLRNLGVKEFKVSTLADADSSGDRFYRRLHLDLLGETNARGYPARIFTGKVN